MKTNKKNKLIKVFENTNIRTKWNAEEEELISSSDFHRATPS